MPVLCDAIAAQDLDRPGGRVARRRLRQEGPAVRRPAAARRSRSPTSSASTTPRRAEVVDLIGAVEGRTALIVDDFTISAGTLVEVAECLVDRGARVGVRGGQPRRVHRRRRWSAWTRSPIERLFITDSVETQPVELSTEGPGRLGRRTVRARRSEGSPTARASLTCSGRARPKLSSGATTSVIRVKPTSTKIERRISRGADVVTEMATKSAVDARMRT